MVTTSATFRSWLKASTNMKLISNVSVLRVTHEGITSYDILVDFDKAAIKNLPRLCKGSIDAITADVANNVQGEAAVPGANVSSISVQRLIVSANAARYYDSIGRTMDASSTHDTHDCFVCLPFNIEGGKDISIVHTRGIHCPID